MAGRFRIAPASTPIWSLGAAAGSRNRISRPFSRTIAPPGCSDPLDEPGLGQDAKVPRDARLALTQHVRQVRDGELTLGTEGQQPQARALGRSPQPHEAVIEASHSEFKNCTNL